MAISWLPMTFETYATSYQINCGKLGRCAVSDAQKVINLWIMMSLATTSTNAASNNIRNNTNPCSVLSAKSFTPTTHFTFLVTLQILLLSSVIREEARDTHYEQFDPGHKAAHPGLLDSNSSSSCSLNPTRPFRLRETQGCSQHTEGGRGLGRSSGLPNAANALVLLETPLVGFSAWALINTFSFQGKTLYSSSEEK